MRDIDKVLWMAMLFIISFTVTFLLPWLIMEARDTILEKVVEACGG